MSAPLATPPHRSAALPLEVSYHPVTWRHRIAGGMRREWVANLVALVGVVLALVGAFLATQAPQLSAWQSGSEIHMGSSVLHSQGGGVFAGAGVIVLSSNGTTETARASGSLHGDATTGVCQMSATVETCRFTVGGSSLTSRDVYRAAQGEWVRTYSDGQVVDITVPSGGAPVPIPFPLGH